MTEQAAPPSAPERLITFRERQMVVTFPSPDKLLVIKRSAARIAAMPENDWTAPEVMRAAEQAYRVVESLLADRADREWIEDQIMDGAMDLEQSMEIIRLALEAFGQDDDSKASVGPAPRKRAARRKVAK